MKNSFSLKFWKYAMAFLVYAAAFALVTNAQIASGGNYTLPQTSIAGGGTSGAGTGGNYSLEATIGQNAAGTNQQNAPDNFQPGFWTVQIFAPTAANVSVGGRILTATGGGIRNVRVTLTGGSGETRTAFSSGFGSFQFNGVPSGETYIISVSAKKYSFAEPAQVFSVLEDVADIIFVANE